MNRCIWVYREMRSGGSWLCNFLAKNLDKTHIFLEHHSQIALNMKPSPLHTRYLFSTHKLEYLSPVKGYDDPLLIRCERKDKFEQMLSEFFFALTNRAVSNIYNEHDCAKFDMMIKQKVNRVTKQDVQNWVDKQRAETSAWNSFSAELSVQHIYYEDFFEGTFIDGIDFPIKFDECTTLRLPDYKQSVFVNYDEIKDWFYSY